MSLREEMWRYEQLTGESAEHIPIIQLGAYLDGVDKGIEELEKVKTEIIGSCNNIAQEVSDLSYTRKIYVYEQLSEIKGAIDDHISELKGENRP